MAQTMELPEGISKEDAEKFLSQQPVVFQTIEISPLSQIRIHRTFYKKKEILSIQKFWKESEDNDWQYGKAISNKYEDIEDILEGYTLMKAWCEDHLEGGD